MDQKRSGHFLDQANVRESGRFWFSDKRHSGRPAMISMEAPPQLIHGLCSNITYFGMLRCTLQPTFVLTNLQSRCVSSNPQCGGNIRRGSTQDERGCTAAKDDRALKWIPLVR
jgi:hypothetical protein